MEELSVHDVRNNAAHAQICPSVVEKGKSYCVAHCIWGQPFAKETFFLPSRACRQDCQRDCKTHRKLLACFWTVCRLPQSKLLRLQPTSCQLTSSSAWVTLTVTPSCRPWVHFSLAGPQWWPVFSMDWAGCPGLCVQCHITADRAASVSAYVASSGQCRHWSTHMAK